MAKCATNASGAMLLINLIQVKESISGSVVPLAMFCSKAVLSQSHVLFGVNLLGFKCGGFNDKYEVLDASWDLTRPPGNERGIYFPPKPYVKCHLLPWLQLIAKFNCKA